MNTELWIPIASFEGRYEVSNGGRVRSVDRTFMRGASIVRRQGVVLKPQPDGDGYLHVALGRGNQRKVHKLVAAAFCPNPDGLPEVDHEDTDKTNCKASNLRWCTKRQNSAYRHEKTHRTCEVRVTPEMAAQIAAEVASGRPIMHVAKETGLSRAHVRRLALPKETRQCVQCLATFSRTAGAGQTFCSRGCHTKHRHGHPPTVETLW